jgi:hypothetical protein
LEAALKGGKEVQTVTETASVKPAIAHAPLPIQESKPTLKIVEKVDSAVPEVNPEELLKGTSDKAISIVNEE